MAAAGRTITVLSVHHTHTFRATTVISRAVWLTEVGTALRSSDIMTIITYVSLLGLLQLSLGRTRLRTITLSSAETIDPNSYRASRNFSSQSYSMRVDVTCV